MNLDNIGVYGFSTTEALGQVAMAGGTWNEQGNAGHWKLVGTTLISDPTDVPIALSDCQAAGIDHHVVIFRDDPGCGNGIGQVWPRCHDSGNVPHYFVIGLFRAHPRPHGGCYTTWGNGAMYSSKDATSIFVHEMGHVLGLGHPHDHPDFDPDSDASVMRQFMWGATFRDLYDWDIRCVEEISLRRATSLYQRVHSTSGFSAASLVSPNVVKGGAGLTYVGGSPHFATSYHRTAGIHSWIGGGPMQYVPGVQPDTAMGFTPAVWREDVGIDYIFHAETLDHPGGTSGWWKSVHRGLVALTADNFASSLVWLFSHCTTMPSFMTCGGTTVVKTRGLVATAWLGEPISRSVVAWINQDRDLSNWGAAANEIRVSVGRVANTIVAAPTNTGIRSQVSPGLACKIDFIDDHDCILAYVPVEDMSCHVRVTRFSVEEGATSYSIDLDPAGPYWLVGNSRSCESITAWHSSSTDRFYVAYRSANAGQSLVVQSSSTGVHWSLDHVALDFPVTFANATSEWGGPTNRIVYLK